MHRGAQRRCVDAAGHDAHLLGAQATERRKIRSASVGDQHEARGVEDGVEEWTSLRLAFDQFGLGPSERYDEGASRVEQGELPRRSSARDVR
jgi:hypothetical protein